MLETSSSRLIDRELGDLYFAPGNPGFEAGYAVPEKGYSLFRKPDIPSGLKAIWFFLMSLLLGPFALWFIYTAKLRRRNRLDNGLTRQSLLTLGLIVFSVFLFWAPVHWSILLGLYLAAGAASAWAMGRRERVRLFALGFGSESGNRPPPADTPEQSAPAKAWLSAPALLAAAMAFYPLVYLLALAHNIGELQNFSIHLPSDVYTDGILWMLYATPAVALAGVLAGRAGYRPSLRSLIYFYAGVGVVLGWIMVWERCDLWLSALVPGSDREAMLFGSKADRAYRAAVKAVFYGGAFVLGVAYLAGARRSAIFARRAGFLGLPSLLAYFNMLFALGDWNFFLDGVRERALENHRYGIFRLAARAGLARTPAAYGTPALLDEWAELEYQSDRREHAIELLRRLQARCGSKNYYAKLRKRAEAELAALEGPGRPAALQLDLPVIKPASYLDQEWYSLLSAVAYLKPDWTDMELKKRLLDLSNTVQLHLPKLDNVPELIPALRQLEIPVTTCFLDADRMRKALAEGKVPFLSLYGHWIPISGYDAGRDGFYYYSYGVPAGQDWLRNEDTDLFYSRPGERFGGPAEKARTRLLRMSLQRFVPRAELEAHVLDIGGVGMVLGDSAFAPRPERTAAFLLEQGDVFYQEHENYPQAAAAYRRAGELFPCEQADSRKLYLKRRFRESASDPRDYQNLFQDYPPAWFATLGPDAASERAIVGKILAGKLGTFLMLNWYAAPGPDTSSETRAEWDTAQSLFEGLRRLDPDEPLYVDSLATLLARSGNLARADSLYGSLAAMYPFGNESAAYRWAWTKLRLGQVEALPALLEQCEGYAGEARYLTMRGAVWMRKHRWRAAHEALTRSLKLDKSLGETHSLLADWYKRKGDDRNKLVHQRWLRRST
jgi:hypothetical protein